MQGPSPSLAGCCPWSPSMAWGTAEGRRPDAPRDESPTLPRRGGRPLGSIALSIPAQGLGSGRQPVQVRARLPLASRRLQHPGLRGVPAVMSACLGSEQHAITGSLPGRPLLGFGGPSLELRSMRNAILVVSLASTDLHTPAYPDSVACPGDSSCQRFPRLVLLVSTAYPSFRSDGASLVICLPITAPVDGQPLEPFSS